jgi:hypothetical protein
MNNPLLAGAQNPNLMQLKQAFQMVKSARNPQAMLSQMMQNNPQYQNVMNYVNANGGDPQKAFYAMAKEKGINPEEILSQLK